jgi:hypothetical protein
MSYHVFFDFSSGLAQRLRVPAGTKKAIIQHIEEVERVLGLKRTQYEKNGNYIHDSPRKVRSENSGAFQFGFGRVGDAH